MLAEIVAALAIRAFYHRHTQLTVGDLGTALDMRVYRDHSGMNLFMLGVVIRLRAEDARPHHIGQLVTS